MEIYRIYNKINKKSYIGSTKWTFNDRYPQGKWWKWTHSHHLKRAVDRYGLENFDMEIFNKSVKTKEELYGLERLYVKQYKSKVPKGYNLTDGGQGCSNPTNVKEYSLIDCYGNLYKVKNLSDFSRKNKLNYGGMLNMVSGIWPHSQGFALKGADPLNIPNPNQIIELENVLTGEFFEIKKKDFGSFEKKQSMKSGTINSLVKKTRLVAYRKWKLKGEKLPNGYILNKSKYNGIKLINENTKEQVIIDGAYAFAKDRGLDRGLIYRLINKKSLTYRGWRIDDGLTKEEREKKVSERKGRRISLKNISTGEIFTIKNVSQFCREKNINLSGFNAMIGGKSKKYGGFSLA